jgi:hypothetical protein
MRRYELTDEQWELIEDLLLVCSFPGSAWEWVGPRLCRKLSK